MNIHNKIGNQKYIPHLEETPEVEDLEGAGCDTNTHLVNSPVWPLNPNTFYRTGQPSSNIICNFQLE